MPVTRGRSWEDPDSEWTADAYTVDGYRGIAWSVYGWELEPDEDTEWSGVEVRTGKILARMVGDDRFFTFDPDEVSAIGKDEFCHGCGQIGCQATKSARRGGE